MSGQNSARWFVSLALVLAVSVSAAGVSGCAATDRQGQQAAVSDYVNKPILRLGLAAMVDAINDHQWASEVPWSSAYHWGALNAAEHWAMAAGLVGDATPPPAVTTAATRLTKATLRMAATMKALSALSAHWPVKLIDGRGKHLIPYNPPPSQVKAYKKWLRTLRDASREWYSALEGWSGAVANEADRVGVGVPLGLARKVQEVRAAAGGVARAFL